MKALILALCFFLSIFAVAQQNQTSTRNLAPIYVVNGKILEYDDFLKLILPQDIELMTILKPAAASSLYGSRAVSGALAITLKPNIKLLPYHKLLKKFRVKKSDRQYVAYIDNQPIQNTSEFYASPSWIKEIRKQNRNNGMADIPYLNIISNK